MRRVRVEIALEADEQRLVQAICRALRPEAEQRLSERGGASLNCSSNALRIVVEARDPGAARALINSYLYWIAGITSCIGEVLEHDRAHTA